MTTMPYLKIFLSTTLGLIMGLFVLVLFTSDVYATHIPSHTGPGSDFHFLQAEFCNYNGGTIWEVAYKFNWNGGNSGYFYVYADSPGSSFTCDGNQVNMTSVGYYQAGPSKPPPYTMTWWTECIDPTIDPNWQIAPSGLGFVGWSDVNITASGGNNLGVVEATRSDGSGCPIGGGPPPPPPPPPVTPATNLRVTSISCVDALTASVTFAWTPASGATFDQQWLDRQRVNNGFDPGTFTGHQLSVGQSTATFNVADGATHYWRINTHVAGGSWYPSNTASSTVGNCLEAANNLRIAQSCGVAGSVTITFRWNRAQGADFDQAWLDFSVFNNNFASGTYQARNVGVAAESLSEGGFAPNVRYYWRINTHEVGDGWHPSNTATFVSQNCYVPPSNLNVSAGCLGPELGVTFRWTLGSQTNLWLDVDDNGFYDGTFWNVNVGSATSFGWNDGNRIGGQAPQYNSTYFWRLWDGVQHVVYAGTVETPNCGSITLSATTGCTTFNAPFVDLNWVSTTGGTNYAIYRNLILFDRVTAPQTSWTWQAPSGDQGVSYSWIVVDLDNLKVSNTVFLITADCKPPSNLSYTQGCNGPNGTLEVTFSWILGSNPNLLMQIFESTPSGLKQVVNVGLNGQTQFVWNGSFPTIIKPPKTNTVYFWRLHDANADANRWGPTISTDDCPGPDLIIDSFTFLDPITSESKNVLNSSESINVRVTYSNIGNANSPSFRIGYYLNPPTEPASDCSSSFPAGVFQQESPALTLAQGANGTWTFPWTAPSTPGLFQAYAFIDYQCIVAELDETNNISAKTSNVRSSAWLQTKGGDVGAKGNIAIVDTPLGETNSDYLLAGNSISSATNGLWELSGYNKPLIPQGSGDGTVYGYFASRFKNKALNEGTALNPCVLQLAMNGFYTCNSDLAIAGLLQVVPTSGNAVIFVEGNLNISKDVNIGSASVVFVVSGNITIDRLVKRVDGVFISNGIFRDCSTDCGSSNQLVINGAVFARSFDLPRALVSANETTAALVINFEPRYLLNFSQIIGTASIQWKEVAP